MFEVCRSLALDKAKFAFTGFLACYWFHIVNWEEAITEKRIAILIKEITKIRTSLLSETQEPENKSLVHSRKKEKKTKMGGIGNLAFFFFFFCFQKENQLTQCSKFLAKITRVTFTFS